MQPRIHDRYLLRQFVRFFLYSAIAFVLIAITVDVFEEIDNFIDHEASWQDILLYYFYSVPFFLTYIVPVSLLLATVFTMGLMARRNELTALVASGISLLRIAVPLLVLSMLVSAGSIYFNDVVVAHSNRQKDDIMRHRIEGAPRSDPDIKDNFRYLGEHGRVYLASRYSHRTKTLFDVVVQEYGGNTLVKRVDARKAEWQDSLWVFQEGFVRDFVAEAESVVAFTELPMPEIVEVPDDFARKEIDEENMNAVELRTHIDRVRRTGGRVEKYLVDLYFKFSFPLAGTIFVLIGIALASGKRKPTIASGFGLTLIVSFLYYVIMRIGQALGHNGALPPLLAAQLGNVIFLVVGVFLVSRANK